MTQQSNSNLRIEMTFKASIFFVFGFITNFSIAIKDQVQLAFDFSNFEARLVNFSFVTDTATARSVLLIPTSPSSH